MTAKRKRPAGEAGREWVPPGREPDDERVVGSDSGVLQPFAGDARKYDYAIYGYVVDA